MRVRIGDQWYSTDDQPICIQLSELEQQQIAAMDRSVAQHGKYAVFPRDPDMTMEKMTEFMQG